MNEQIRELEVQAGMQYRLGQFVNIDKNGTHTFEEEKVYDTFDTEKFAELVARRCIKVALDADDPILAVEMADLFGIESWLGH